MGRFMPHSTVSKYYKDCEHYKNCEHYKHCEHRQIVKPYVSSTTYRQRPVRKQCWASSTPKKYEILSLC